MGQVTALTAEKSLELADANIVNAHLSGYNLILTKRSGQEINVGNIRGLAGPTGGVSEEAMNTAIALAINNSVSDVGKGLVAYDDVLTQQDYSFMGNDWVDVTGCSISYTFVPGRAYRFGIAGAVRSDFDGNTRFSLALRETSGNAPLVRAAGFSDDNSWLVTMSGSRVVIAPSGWGTRGYKLSMYSNVEHTVHIESDIIPAQITVEDLGVL